MDRKFWVAFNASLKIGPSRFKKLYSFFDSMAEAWEASEKEFEQAGLKQEVILEINELRRKINPDKELKKVENEGIEVITIKDKAYPSALNELYDPPALLYVKGEIVPEDQLALAVVGTRRMTSYGARITPRICQGCALNGLTIISGLALGIDALAHRSTLDASGRTIAVLAGGIDEASIYPPANRGLAEKIQKNGAIISEQHLKTPCLKEFFPARNRIISGLSLGVLVIEAAEKSGALITAQAALDQNREVFAVPGPIYSPASIGPNNLIKLGAKLVSGYQDILDELSLEERVKAGESRKILPETKEEKNILEILTTEPLHIDKIVKKLKLSASAVSSTLTIMEMKGLAKNLGGGNYIKND